MKSFVAIASIGNIYRLMETQARLHQGAINLFWIDSKYIDVDQDWIGYPTSPEQCRVFCLLTGALAGMAFTLADGGFGLGGTTVCRERRRPAQGACI
jgi:hypothetical protein